MDRDENSNSDSGDIVAYLRSNNNGSKKRKRDIDGDADSAVGPKPKDREEIELENMLFGDTTIVNKSNQTPYELALVSQNPSIGSIIQSHKTDHVVPFRETPIINPKRRSIYIEPDKHSNSLSFNSRSQSMPKLNGINLLRRSHSPSTNEQFSQQHQSSRSSSPKSFSDHGFGSECASHLSSNSPNGTNAGYTCKRKRLYAAAPGRKSLCIKSYQANTPGELSINKGDIVESMFAISVFQ